MTTHRHTADQRAPHRYPVTAGWAGSTGVGYSEYSRTHVVRCGDRSFEMSADPAFLGSPSLVNPEQLLVMAAVSCQLLSFLAVASRARIDVVSYTDDALGEMPEDWITRITLRPAVAVREGPSEERVRHLLEVAHRECYIARSLRSEIVLEPTVAFV